MQTFLPYPDFASSARVLDYRRLGKQRVEAKQILMALSGLTKGWRNHPATRMWAGHSSVLCDYAKAICDEWVSRGYNDTLSEWFINERSRLGNDDPPRWLGDPLFHASHRSNLLRKDSTWYGQFGWIEKPDLPYVWPV